MAGWVCGIGKFVERWVVGLVESQLAARGLEDLKSPLARATAMGRRVYLLFHLFTWGVALVEHNEPINTLGML